jgi:hypothetical protein
MAGVPDRLAEAPKSVARGTTTFAVVRSTAAVCRQAELVIGCQDRSKSVAHQHGTA